MSDPQYTSDIPLKRCSRCGVEFPATTEYFCASSSGKYGVHSRCRVCERERAREYWNRPENKERQQAYIQRPDVKQKRYDRHHRWNRTADGKRSNNINTAKRRAARHNNGGDFTSSELKAVFAAHTNKKTGELICAWCGKPINGDKYHIDHWIPLKHGGANDAGNLRIMHPHCNLKKQSTHPHDLGRLI